eukprot:2360571-Rhodomonas_salina.1
MGMDAGMSVSVLGVCGSVGGAHGVGVLVCVCVVGKRAHGCGYECERARSVGECGGVWEGHMVQ